MSSTKLEPVPEPRLTDFEQVLLGLICIEPSSGYDLKRRFSSTPLGVYQPSSGALYPALARLLSKGMVRQVPTGPAGPARRRFVYEAAPAGREVNRTWAVLPPSPETVARDLGLHLMRFVMMESLLPRQDVLAWLGDLIAALSEFVADLERYRAAAPDGTAHRVLALDHGIAVYRSSLAWAQGTSGTLANDAAPHRAAVLDATASGHGAGGEETEQFGAIVAAE
jgi:PadR family transcriptional regulator AphA